MFPAAVVIIGTTLEVSLAARSTEAYPSKLAWEDNASRFCAREILGSLKKLKTFTSGRRF